MRIVGVTAHDLRAPTSRTLAGSDAAHADPDYSAAYAVLHTDDPNGVQGEGMTFTIGRGNDLVCDAIDALAHHVVGRDLDDLVGDMAGTWRSITSDSQLRWLGPEKGVIHLATAALVNALWDLWAKRERKPVWQLVCDMTPEQLVACIDFRYLTDALTPEQAVELLRRNEATKAERIAELRRDGYPAYITSAGWLGYPEEKVRALCREMKAAGWTSFKTKVGISVESDIRRIEVMREELGDDIQLMADANQVWDVPEAIDWVRQLPTGLRWIEEPTSPDDALGHAEIRAAIAPVGVATGEHAANRVVFKQLLQAEAIDYCQVDACRLGGLNEVLAVLLLAAHFDVPVCPHAGGIGLCEMVQHISVIDYVAVSASLEDRTTEYASHLHEHFVHPALVKDGRYLVPEAPGYSMALVPGTFEALSWPGGSEWR
ncbi:MAG TPA: enolase C-terminal domain-like protein [Acidimicrobiales bacterium]|nr:enolase C-terminal domain-like protein [Acidimicrobiales bacterium]